MKAVRARRAAALAGLPLWLSLRRIRPVSDEFGFDRGTPVDRVYLEEFLDEHSTEVHGDVLEVKSPAYTHRFGGDRVTRAHVLDLDPANEKATIVADLYEPGSLPPQGYDCVILSQTLQFVRLPEAALANVWSVAAPGRDAAAHSASRLEARPRSRHVALHSGGAGGAARAGPAPGASRRWSPTATC